MSYLIHALMLMAFIFIMEKALVFHAKLYLSSALNEHSKIKDPPLFRPLWRVAVYLGYIVGGVAALEGLVQRPVGFALILLPTLMLGILDVFAVRRTLAEKRRTGG